MAGVVGIALGMLIGVISGTVALVLLKTANTASINNVRSLLAITTEILAIPASWVGGGTGLLKLVKFEGIMNFYVVALATTFLIVVVYPIAKWIIQLAKELGEGTK